MMDGYAAVSGLLSCSHKPNNHRLGGPLPILPPPLLLPLLARLSKLLFRKTRHMLAPLSIVSESSSNNIYAVSP
jgi:hypothetical protein